MLFSTSSHKRVLFGEDADNPGSDLVVNNRLVVLANDINTKFLADIFGLKVSDSGSARNLTYDNVV